MSNPNAWNESPESPESPDPESLGSGATPQGNESGEQDTASGGAPEPAHMTDPNGTPVENPSG